MLLYNITFADDKICGEDGLYCHGGERRDSCVFLKSGEKATFDTYFNSFSHTKYKKYTKVKNVVLKLDIEGRGATSVYLYKLNATPQIIASTQADGPCELQIDLSTVENDGFLYFTFDAAADSMIRGGGWFADVEINPVKIGVVICTYRREEYLRRNIANLSEYIRSLSDSFFDVFVIDNGRTVEDNFGEGIFVIPNDNTGGSGGFTRGIKEVLKGDYTHFLLMDDDIVFDVNTLQRIYAMLCVLCDEYKDASVGGAMLILDRPYLQEEIGAMWDGIDIKSVNKRLDARKPQTVYLNETLEEPDYNAWFFMCMPVSAPKKYGYPLPFFVRCDDVEYGLRAGGNIINMSGISVWHEGFDVKYSAEMEYYFKRNKLIVSARYPKGKSAFAIFKKLVLSVGQQLMLQRYFAVDLIFKAYDDFFKGADYFLNLDMEKNHKEIRACGPKMLTAEQIKDKYGIEVDLERINSHKKWRFKNFITLNGYLIPKCFYKKGVGQVNMVTAKGQDLYKYKRVLHYNPKFDCGFVTEIKKSKLIGCWCKLLKYLFKMLFGYRRVAKQYKQIQS